MEQTYICKCGKAHFLNEDLLEKCTNESPILHVCLNCNRAVSFIDNNLEHFEISSYIDKLLIKEDNMFCGIVISRGKPIYYSNSDGELFEIVNFNGNVLTPNPVAINRKKPSLVKGDLIDYKETKKQLSDGEYTSFRQWYENNIKGGDFNE